MVVICVCFRKSIIQINEDVVLEARGYVDRVPRVSKFNVITLRALNGVGINGVGKQPANHQANSS